MRAVLACYSHCVWNISFRVHWVLFWISLYSTRPHCSQYWTCNLNNKRGFKAHQDQSVRDISIAPSDVKFVTASDDMTVKLWDFETITCERTFKGMFVCVDAFRTCETDKCIAALMLSVTFTPNYVYVSFCASLFESISFFHALFSPQATVLTSSARSGTRKNLCSRPVRRTRPSNCGTRNHLGVHE